MAANWEENKNNSTQKLVLGQNSAIST